VNTVDVIVPCYRYGHYLRDCVASVLAQVDVEVRILIIDDASPDNSADVAASLAKEDARVAFRCHQINQGHISTYNEGIEWASADYLLLLSADDYLLPGALSSATNLMNAHPEVGFTYGKAMEMTDSDIEAQTKETNHPTEKTSWRILTGLEFIELSGANNIVRTPTAVVRTKLQKRLGGYCPKLPHSGDMEMWLRLSTYSSVGISEDYQAVYRRHGSNMSEAYMTDSWLPDVQQRKAALDYYFQTCSDVLPNPQTLRHKLYWLLGVDAISLASAAFNEGQTNACEKLTDYALDICPNIKRSFVWQKLTFKRVIGFKIWLTLQPIVSFLRQVFSSK
jgi:Glycosyl transferase family 2